MQHCNKPYLDREVANCLEAIFQKSQISRMVTINQSFSLVPDAWYRMYLMMKTKKEDLFSNAEV